MKLRVILISIILALLAIAGCKAQAQHPAPVNTPASVKLTDPTPVGPPTTVNVSSATLDFAKVVVTTEAKPVEVVEVAPVEVMEVALAQPVAQTFVPVKPYIPAPVVVEPVTPTAYHQPVPQVPAPVKVCMEDEPCWDCSTMGNRICGPVAQPTAPVNTTVTVGWTVDTCPATWYWFAPDALCIDPATLPAVDTVPAPVVDVPVTVEQPTQSTEDCHKKLLEKKQDKGLHLAKGHEKIDSSAGKNHKN